MQYYILIDPGTKRGVGASRTEAPGYLPHDNEVPCTSEQATNPTAWMLSGGDLVEAPPVEPEPMPDPLLPSLSPRQFAAGLWGDKIISFDEADAYISTRVIPSKLKMLLETSSFPDDDTGEPTPRKEAILLLKGAVEFQFKHPLVDEIRLAQNWTPDQLRARWAVWATL